MVMIWLVYSHYSLPALLVSVEHSYVFGLACCGENLSGEIFGFSLPLKYGLSVITPPVLPVCGQPIMITLHHLYHHQDHHNGLRNLSN